MSAKDVKFSDDARSRMLEGVKRLRMPSKLRWGPRDVT
ncbi:MAG: hypothetical protein CM1200mP9_00900 [Gammaproteobacteria bacterium]|nr:MAG: hypothetical protein CM1200mP9_00900 [Gammaproteobacteria bacterium]